MISSFTWYNVPVISLARKLSFKERVGSLGIQYSKRNEERKKEKERRIEGKGQGCQGISSNLARPCTEATVLVAAQTLVDERTIHFGARFRDVVSSHQCREIRVYVRNEAIKCVCDIFTCSLFLS